MSRVILAVLVVLAIFAIGSFGQDQQCGENEQFNACGSACEPTCGKPRATICTFQCKIGCECKEGYMRNSEGRCVLEKNC